MHKQLILIAALLTTPSFAQEATKPTLAATPATNTITINSNAHIWQSPDLVKVQITITEYVHTDPVSQETTSIELSTIKNTLCEKLKELGVDQNELQFASMAEGNNHYNYGNQYALTPYTNTQKKSLSAAYNLKWKASENELTKLFEALRFNGVTSVVLQCDYSQELDAEIRQELLENCIKEGQEDAMIAARIANKKLGEIVSIANSTNENSMPVYSGGNMYYNNSLNAQKHTCSATITFELLD
jgi:uncharacterized protein YggE